MEEAASPEAVKMSHVNTTVSKEGISSKFVESGSKAVNVARLSSSFSFNAMARSSSDGAVTADCVVVVEVDLVVDSVVEDVVDSEELEAIVVEVDSLATLEAEEDSVTTAVEVLVERVVVETVVVDDVVVLDEDKDTSVELEEVEVVVESVTVVVVVTGELEVSNVGSTIMEL